MFRKKPGVSEKESKSIMDIGNFAHSFDRETFQGAADTRQAALKAAFEKLPQLESSPEAVYVGKRVPVDPGSSGLAEMIMGAMRRRVRDVTGDNSSQYLIRVNEHQLAELDDEIDRVVRTWLAKHELMPTQSKIIAISEHPVPQPKMNTTSKSTNGEVGELGETDFPISMW
jgi:hypothetical protein